MAKEAKMFKGLFVRAFLKFMFSPNVKMNSAIISHLMKTHPEIVWCAWTYAATAPQRYGWLGLKWVTLYEFLWEAQDILFHRGYFEGRIAIVLFKALVKVAGHENMTELCRAFVDDEDVIYPEPDSLDPLEWLAEGREPYVKRVFTEQEEAGAEYMAGCNQ